MTPADVAAVLRQLADEVERRARIVTSFSTTIDRPPVVDPLSPMPWAQYVPGGKVTIEMQVTYHIERDRELLRTKDMPA